MAARLVLFQDVLEEVGPARAAVDETVGAHPAEAGQAREEAAAWGGQYLDRPVERGGGVGVEPVQDLRRQRRLVVVAAHRPRARLPQAIDHRVGIGAVADDVTHDQDLVHRRQHLQDGLQRLQVAVDVAEEGEPGAQA